MEFVFGTQGEIEVLKTKGSEHTDLTGYQEVIQNSQDQTITDRFRVVRKIKSDEDVGGNCYDWYEIDRHNRIVDRSGVAVRMAEQNAANLDYLSMMAGIDLPNADQEGGVNNERA